MNNWVDSLLLIVIISNLALLGSSQLRSCIRLVAFQGVALGLLPLVVRDGAPTVWVMLLCAATIALKGVIFPRLLVAALEGANIRREVEPFVGYTASILWGLFSLTISVWLASRLPAFGHVSSSLLVPVSFFLIFVGLFITVSRRKAISQILGDIVLENGTFVFGMALLRETPLLVELGVLLDAFAAVFVMGVAVHHINREFDHIDVDQLDSLRG